MGRTGTTPNVSGGTGRSCSGRDVNGKMVRPKRSAKTKAEVRVLLRRLREEFDAGVTVGEHVTVAEFAAVVAGGSGPARRGRNGQAVSLSTLEKDRVLVLGHLVPALGRHKLTELTSEHIELMLRHKLNEEGLGHDWVRRLRARLVEILRHAERRGRVRRNVAAISVMPRPITEPVRRRALSVDQAQQLLRASEGHRLHALVVVGLMLGLRPAELRGLTWDDIDFEAGTLRVSGVEQGGRRVDEVKVNHERAKRNLVMPAR